MAKKAKVIVPEKIETEEDLPLIEMESILTETEVEIGETEIEVVEVVQVKPNAPPVVRTVRKRVKNYLNNEDLMREISLSKKNQKKHPKWRPSQCLTLELTKMLMALVDKYSTKHNWRNYSYLDDMKGEARLSLCQNALKFNPEKSQNPFGYYTQIVTHSFLTYMERERRLRECRDVLIEQANMTGSFSRQMENENEWRDNTPGEVRITYTRPEDA